MLKLKRRNESGAMIRQEPFAYIAEYNADGNIEFEAWASPGTGTTTAEWICAKHTYSSNQLINTKWAKDVNGQIATFGNKANALSGLTYD